MREAMDPWIFVAASYAIGIAATVTMVAWSLLSMKRAEKRRDEARKR
ncbi:hypothetical protein [Novosphingobium mangrovi (ex Huang et al. 2023)]|uniref:Heme exporter protein D n=1 Tax=Novosphingobium mangrovi (ex Huang et al. 2023) TaxID=2976432 RepID=A0ABT2I6X8_9SPHN|nr:hypothetical protein [Novosphingobium mangrovi (ex Huang et al. 2023)]MCT2400574.1 hypothetical protein [Novosphingobium mangrovi (ex Huang et al. 2023)]